MKLWSSYASYFCFSFGWHLSISRSFFSWDHASPNLKGPPGYETIERRNGERRLRRHSAQPPQSPKGFHVQALVALVRLPNYLMASCSLLLGSLDLLQRKSLHGSPQRQSLHVSSFVSACRSVMHHFSASRYMALHSANRFMSIFNSLSALAAHAPLHSL